MNSSRLKKILHLIERQYNNLKICFKIKKIVQIKLLNFESSMYIYTYTRIGFAMGGRQMPWPYTIMIDFAKMQNKIYIFNELKSGKRWKIMLFLCKI